MISSSPSSYSTEPCYTRHQSQSKKFKVSNEGNAGIVSTFNNTIESSTAVVTTTSSSSNNTTESCSIMKTVSDVYPKIKSANDARIFSELLIAKNVKISSYDKWSREIRRVYPDCLVDMKRPPTAAVGYGDLYIITYMPGDVHNSSVVYFITLIGNYCSQSDVYKDALFDSFPSAVGLDPDAGMGVLLPHFPNDRNSVRRTVLIEVERSNRTLLELHTHMIQNMNQFSVKFGVGIKINARRHDGNFAVVCLLFNRDRNDLAICFRAIDFGTANVGPIQVNVIATNIRIRLEELVPRVTVNPQNNTLLSTGVSPWGHNGTFTIAARDIFGGLSNGDIIDGAQIHLPDGPTDLVVDLFELLRKICKFL